MQLLTTILQVCLFTIKSSVLLLSSLALPNPILSVTSVGSTVTGQTVALVCYVTMATDQIPHSSVNWVKVSGGSSTFPTATQQTTPISTILTLSFSPLTFSHRGLYLCVVTHNISTVYTFTGNKDYNISVDCEYIELILTVTLFTLSSSSLSSYSGSPTCQPSSTHGSWYSS